MRTDTFIPFCYIPSQDATLFHVERSLLTAQLQLSVYSYIRTIRNMEVLMAVPRTEAERRVESFTQALRHSGLRLTHQRLEVVREIAGTDEHPDVESIYGRVRARVPTISLDTVYRTLATLADQGLVVRVSSATGPARYDANTKHHHHFTCTRCGMVRDISDSGLDAVKAPSSTSAIGVVESVEVQLRGVCSKCAMQESDPSKGAR